MNRKDYEALAEAIKAGWPIGTGRREAASRLATGLVLTGECRTKFLKLCGVVHAAPE